jgi:hypothetical protein
MSIDQTLVVPPKAPSGSRRLKFLLAALTLFALAGCNRFGKPHDDLVGSWRFGPAAKPSHILRFHADGVYEDLVFLGWEMNPSGAPMKSAPGKWGVKDGLLLVGTASQVTGEYKWEMERDKSPVVLRLTRVSKMSLSQGTRLEAVTELPVRYEKSP